MATLERVGQYRGTPEGHAYKGGRMRPENVRPVALSAARGICTLCGKGKAAHTSF